MKRIMLWILTLFAAFTIIWVSTPSAQAAPLTGFHCDDNMHYGDSPDWAYCVYTYSHVNSAGQIILDKIELQVDSPDLNPQGVYNADLHIVSNGVWVWRKDNFTTANPNYITWWPNKVVNSVAVWMMTATYDRHNAKNVSTCDSWWVSQAGKDRHPTSCG